MTEFSVVIPCYNSEEFIEKTLKSVLRQDFSDYEIVISDDGSTDNTLDVIKNLIGEFGDRQVTILQTETRTGPGGARNRGVAKAKGNWICFLDADDIWYLNKLSVIKHYIDTNPHVDIVCHSQIWRSPDKSYVVNYKKIFDDSVHPFISLLRRNCIGTSAVCISRTELLKEKGFDTKLFNNQDYDLWLRLATHCQLGFVEESLGEYNIRKEGISRNHLRRYRFLLIIVWKHRLNIQRFSASPILEVLRYVGNKSTSVGLGLVKTGNPFLGWIIGGIGLIFWPPRVFDFLRGRLAGLS